MGTASAAIPGGSSLDTGSSTTASTPTSSGSSGAAGGYVTHINITSTGQQTTNWQGFYGNVTSGKIFLNDSAGNSMYNWTINVSNGGYVYTTTNSSAPTWASLTSIAAATLDGAGYWNLGSKSDNITNTYTSTGTITAAGVLVNNAIKTTVNTNFNDYALSDQSGAGDRNQVIWAGAINNDAANFDGTSSDYELLVPAFAGDTYYFYIEMA